MMNNAFCFLLKVLFVLKIFKFLFRLFIHVGKRLDKKAKLFLKLMTSQTEKKNYKTHIAQYLKKQWQSDNEIWSANRI